jgi:hypothetical protein
MFRRALPLLFLLSCSVSALRVAATRRDALRMVSVASLSAMPVSPAAAAPKYLIPIDDDMKLAIVRTRQLRSAVATGAAARRNLPLIDGENNYRKLTEQVSRAKVALLLPLQQRFKALAAANVGTLPAEIEKALALQPILMQGHLLELDQALAEYKFDAYQSKRTGKVYPGGKVERELEEVEEVCDDFLKLAMGELEGTCGRKEGCAPA